MWQYLQLVAERIQSGVGPALASAPAQFVMMPAFVFMEPLGLTGSLVGRMIAFILGWNFWMLLLRSLYFSAFRLAGIASVSQYRYWRRLSFPWEWVYLFALRIKRWRRSLEFAPGPNQKWASFWEIAAHWWNPDSAQVPVGRLSFLLRLGLHAPIAIDGEKAVCYVAAAGSGKTSQLAVWLGCLADTAGGCVFDMEGALVDAFGEHLEKRGHKVVKLDADFIAKGYAKSGHWNPFAELTFVMNCPDLGPAQVLPFATRMAHAFITEDSKTQPVFARRARVFTLALILYTFLFEKNPSIKRLRTLMARGLPEQVEPDSNQTAFGWLLFEMGAAVEKAGAEGIDDGCGGALFEAIANAKGLVNEMPEAGKQDEFRATMIYQCAWMDDPNVQTMTASSDFNAVELKISNTVVFICASLSDVQTRLGPVMRTFLSMALYYFQKYRPKMKLRIPALFLLDEFTQLGVGAGIADIETALPGFRKFGARVVTVGQSVGLYRAISPEKYKEFFNQAQCVVWMGISPTDKESLEFLDSVLGGTVQLEYVGGYHWSLRLIAALLGKQLSKGQPREVTRRLLETQQAAAFLNPANGQLIVTRGDGKPPFRLRRLEYWRDLSVKQYRPHEGHRETFLRALTRRGL